MQITNPQSKLEDLVRNSPDFLAESGSRLYGTDKPDSDYDLRGFVLPPEEYIIGILNFECMEVPGADHKIHSLKRFIDLIMRGDPQLTECLFVPQSKIIKISAVGEKILSNRHMMLSNRIYNRIVGFGYSEWRKAAGERIVFDDRPKDSDDIIAWIRDNKGWDKDRMDEFVAWMDEDRSMKVVKSQKDLGAKRKKEFTTFGYGVSQAAHSIRLIGELIEIMETGELIFPRPNSDYLREIRAGKHTLSEVEKVKNELLLKAEAAKSRSVLPDKPDPGIYDIYRDIVLESIKGPKK